MSNLILDPLTHAPHLKYLIPNNYYYTQPNSVSYPPGQYSIDAFVEKYLFNFNDDIKEINKIVNNNEHFNNLFLVIPVYDIKGIDKQKGNIHVFNLFNNLLNKYKYYIYNKIIIIDNYDWDYNSFECLKLLNLKYDLILKRVYSNKNIHNYKDNVYSYPFVMCTNNDPFWNLLNKNHFINNEKKNKIIWSGTLFKFNKNNEDVNEYCNRSNVINDFSKKYPECIDIKSIPYCNFLNEISLYKYCLDLRGCSRLNKRLYEILSTDCLLLAEKIDIIWPFEENDSFSDECFFEPGNTDDLYNKFTNFENNNDLYIKCLENQKYIVKKYFNNDWIWSYISKLI